MHACQEETSKSKQEQQLKEQAAQGQAGRKRPDEAPPAVPLEKKRTKFETYASATSNAQQR